MNKSDQNADRKKLRMLSMAASILCGAMGALIVLLIIGMIGYHYVDFSFLKATPITSDGHGSFCFVDNKWDSGTYLSVIANFYSNIITVLGCLLGGVVGLAFIVVRGNALQRAEEHIKKEVEGFFATTNAESKIQSELKKISGEAFGKLDELIVALYQAEVLPNGLLDTGNKDEKKANKTD